MSGETIQRLVHELETLPDSDQESVLRFLKDLKRERSGEGEVGAPRKATSVLCMENGLTESEFRDLVTAWRQETRFHSALSKKFTHWAYVTIMAAGKAALPFILRELERETDHWFYALRYIARRDVAAGASTMDAAKAAWLIWGRENRYI